MTSVPFLNEQERRRIAEAIHTVERRTSGELVAVVSAASDSYVLFPLLAAALVALLTPAAIWLTADVGLLEAHAVQLGVFLVVAGLGWWRPVRLCLVPATVKRRNTARAAQQQFYRQGLHRTRDRTGVLLFVSLAERAVEVLADSGINEKVAPGTWDRIVAEFTMQMKSGRPVDGLVAAIEAMGGILAQHFPAGADDRNELPDAPVEV